jgi:predicted flap endonuclease-1-like 5' DNA nuclease
MLRRLFRLLIIALLLAIAAYFVSRFMGGDEDDFDDFDDLDSEFEFQETPVEIDVAASDIASPPTATHATPSPASSPAQSTTSTSATSSAVRLDDADVSSDRSGDATANVSSEGRLIDIVGIGPAYEARLQSIGINSIHDLAHADPDMIASQIEVIGGAATVGDWIDQARSHHSHGQS